MKENWTVIELRAAVEAYVEMHNKESNQIVFGKKEYYEKLSSQFGRTIKAYEYRMQNISYVYSLLGRNWVSGLKPAKNIGPKNVKLIESLLIDIEGLEFPEVAEYEKQVRTYRSNPILTMPDGIKEPDRDYKTITIYNRDPKVKAWVLKNANGFCECCDKKAPFITTDGEPFLEVHHIRHLASGGSDTVSNTIALCANCHREFHYGQNKDSLKQSMFRKIERLQPE